MTATHDVLPVSQSILQHLKGQSGDYAFIRIYGTSLFQKKAKTSRN